ncbi:MAG: PilZ domain-containing protein [Candidatus Omnitrophica bacterium]|nr:PilZ domain-containing protein [Candidatus Omnitrophota bacterium]
MVWAGLDQRAFPRISARCDILIHDHIGGTIRAKTQNLGGGGVCVILNRELEKLSRVRLRLILEETTYPIECEGRIVWMVRSRELPSGKVHFDTGIEFLGLRPLDRERISAFIENRRPS